MTAFATDTLGEIAYVELPEPGVAVVVGEACGRAVAVNEKVVDDPGLVNRDPHRKGWLFLVEAEEDGRELLDAESYAGW